MFTQAYRSKYGRLGAMHLIGRCCTSHFDHVTWFIILLLNVWMFYLRHIFIMTMWKLGGLGASVDSVICHLTVTLCVWDQRQRLISAVFLNFLWIVPFRYFGNIKKQIENRPDLFLCHHPESFILFGVSQTTFVGSEFGLLDVLAFGKILHMLAMCLNMKRLTVHLWTFKDYWW